MTRMLVVPIDLDALVPGKPIPLVEAFVDFGHLSDSNGQIDINPDKPNISENILSQPFQNTNLYLDAGVHLHWPSPDALTTGTRDADGKTEFPAVPNCWLATRTRPTDKKAMDRGR